MYKVKKITSQNVSEIDFVYKDFSRRAFIDYGFEIQPLPFEHIVDFLDKGILNIMSVYQEGDNFSRGILIYALQPDVVELSVIHCPGGEDIIQKKEALVKSMQDQLKGTNFKLISYAMLGVQGDFIRKITHYGFEFVGQAIARFKFNNEKSLQIFNKVGNKPVPDGYEIISWDDKYSKDIIKLIRSSFEGMKDSKFDPRFKDDEGCEDILAKIVENIYGDFLPENTKILLEKGVPKGFCMVNLTTESLANVPIIGVDKEHKSKGFGVLLLQEALKSVIQDVMSGKLKAVELNATVDTDNFAAIRMYRKLGFKEDNHYAQAYCRLQK